MLKLIKRPDSPHWQICGTLRGIRVRESTGTDSRAHAEVILAKRQQEVLDGIVYGQDRVTILADAIVSYIESGRSEKYLRPIVDHFGAWRICDISQTEVTRLAQKLFPNRSPATINRHLYTPLIAVLNHAKRSGMVKSIPTLTRPKERQKPTVYANDEWLVQFLAQNMPKPLRAIVLFMSFTGSRVTEACRLEWSDIDWDIGRALLRTTKNGTSRQVALAEVVLEELRGLQKPVGRVFGYSSRYSVNQAIERVCKRSGVPYMSSHKVGRHAFAARLLKNGHSLKVVAEAGGWKSIQLASRTYGHLEHSQVDSAVTAADAALKSMTGKASAEIVELRSGACCVYIVSSAGYYKIGIAENVASRIGGIQTGTPHKVELRATRVFATRAAARACEQHAHKLLADFRLSGEWFACDLETAIAAIENDVSDLTRRLDEGIDFA
jgi:integrase